MGAVFALVYFLYFTYGLYGAVFYEKWEAEIILAYASFPSSAAFFALFDSVLDWLGPYGSSARRVGTWFLLGMAGGLQYFALGFLFSRCLKPKT